MKKKYAVWTLICLGLLLLVLSVGLTFHRAANTPIIGGIGWPSVFRLWRNWYGSLTWYGAFLLLTAWVISVKNRYIHRAAMLLVPLTLFPTLRISYNWLNRNFLAPWLGCGCPKKDEFGNLLACQFNANDFSCIFWFLAALGMAVLSFFIGRKIFIKRKWLTAVYIAATLGLSLFVFRNYCLSMWWG
jgi:hypothetical protein